CMYPGLPHLYLYFLLIRHPPTSQLFPYTTLFRSRDPPGRQAARTSPHEPAHLVHGAARASTLAVLRSSRSSAQGARWRVAIRARSEEHTSELQSRFDLVCRLLLEKKKTISTNLIA